MKKILLSTTALSMIAASSAFAAPNVTVGGFIDFQAASVDEDVSNPASSRDLTFQNDTEIHVKVDGKTDSGLGYGAVVELEADIAGDDNNQGLNSDRTFVYVESGIGRIELGSNTSASAALRVDASTFARATGGIDGDYSDSASIDRLRFSQAGATLGGQYFDRPGLLTEVAQGDTADATKITYYTPRVSGLQFGASYTPDTGNTGSSLTNSTENDAFQYENVFNLGLNYQGEVENVGINASLTGEFGDAENAANDDLSGYTFGVNLDVAGLAIGGSYGERDTSAAGDNDYYTLGLGYNFGPFATSVTYYDSDNSGNELENLSFGADYQLAPGLVPYVEVNFFEEDDNNAATVDNEGTVVLVGTELSF